MRPRAWAMAQRRHVARLWHREKGLTAEQKSVLDALHHLSDQQRKMLLLTHLAGLDGDSVGRELGETPARVDHQLEAATLAFCAATGVPEDGVLAAIESLAPVVEATVLPRPATIHRGGRRRRRVHAVVGVATLLLLTLVGGVFVLRGGVTQPAAARSGDEAVPVTADMLLTVEQVHPVAPRAPWQLTATSDNTGGTGINSVCQVARFADPRGRGTFVRAFAAPGRTTRNLVETVEDIPEPASRRGGVPDDAAVVRRLPGGPGAAAQQLSDPRSRGQGTDGETAHPQRRAAHLRRRAGPPAPGRSRSRR